MYHMVTFPSPPPLAPSRGYHGWYQNKISDCVDRVLLETEVVDNENPAGNNLYNTVDSFLSYGFLKADRCYWRCIRQYMPRAEVQMLIAECGDANDRFLSLGWLKTAFNKGTLYFYMLSLCNQSNKRYLTRFYHRDSCIRNSGLLEAVTGLLGKLQHVQFALYSTRHLRDAPIPAVIIDTAPVSLSSRAAARQRKLTECEASSDMVLNVLPTEVPAILTTTVDQDVMLEELVRSRRNRLYSEQVNAQKAAYEEEMTPEKVEVPVVEEKLEDVLVKTMSQIDIDLTVTPLEDVLGLGTEPFEDTITFKLSDGEIQLPQRDILNLAINVFEKPSERVMESFVVFENFHGDPMKERYFVMTNFNVYVLKYIEEERPIDLEGSPSPVPGEYVPVFKLAHDKIKCIQMSIDNLSFNLIADETGFTVYDKTELPRTSYVASICSFDAGARLLNALIQVTNFTEREVKNKLEVDDRESYMMLLQPNLTREFSAVAEVSAGFLCYWCEQAFDAVQPPPPEKKGYLYFRHADRGMTSWLIKNQSHHDQKFCHVRAHRFIIYANASSSEEELNISLRRCRYIQKGRSSFILESTVGTFEFEAADREGFHSWLTLISDAIADRGIRMFLTPILNIVTNDGFAVVQEGEKFWNDGFIRFVHKLGGSNIKLCIVIYPNNDELFGNKYPAICIQTAETHHMNYFFFRFVSELDRFVAVFKDNYAHVPMVVMDDAYAKDEVGKKAHDMCCGVEILWHTHQ